jgi:uncharacterized membrane protein
MPALHRDTFQAVASGIAVVIEAVGILVLVAGLLLASVVFVRHCIRKQPVDEALHAYRGNLGRAILLGLEFLVAADIVGTVVVDPTYETVGVLALIIALRTFLSFALDVEVNGHWPWHRTAMSTARTLGAPS